MLKVELHTNEIPGLFARFKDVIDERYWLKRITSIKEEIRGHSLLADFLAKTKGTGVDLNFE